ncbi:unnamed protein product [Rotaria magnacalcarata]|nr:unnamed protein product [Rotaria magnacalcarata]
MIASKSGSSTIQKYEALWKKFQKFCVPFQNKLLTENLVLKYLFSLFKTGLALQTMSTHRAALADPLFYGGAIDPNSKIFKDFFISCWTRRPIKKCLPPKWEVDKVLQLLKSPTFSINSTISLAALLLKTIFLIGLASGSRITEIAALRQDSDHCEFLRHNKGVSRSGFPKMLIWRAMATRDRQMATPNNCV